MKIWTLAASTAFATLSLGAAAQADVTPEDVWADWKAMSEAWGQEISVGTEARTGDALVLTDVRIVTDQPDTRVETTVGTITLTDKGDGTVEITSSPTMPVSITTTPPAPEGEPAPGPTTIDLTLAQSGMVMTASGQPGDTRYDYVIPMLAAELGKITSPEGGDETIDLKLTANNASGSYALAGEARDMTSDMKADNMVAVFGATNPQNGGRLDLTAELASVVMTSTASAMGRMASGDVVAALKDGFATLGAFAYESSSLSFEFDEGATTAAGSGTGGPGTLNVAMDAGKFAYGGSASDVQMQMQTSELPFPVSFAYDRSAFDLVMPAVAGPDPQDYRLSTRLEGLTVSDDVWNLFDPSKVLPRDPATLVIDTSGTATLTADLADPAAATPGAAPGEVNTLDVNELHLNIAGADLTGTGALSFDNDDMVTFQGFPAPTGTLDLRLVGGNGLIDKGVQMGLIPQEQALGARMMLGMFARAVEGATDTMTSKIEFRDKHLFVNGQMLQ